MWKARSSSDQWVVGTPTSAGGVVASTSTWCLASGGKSGRSAATRGVGEAIEAQPLKASSPLGDGVGGAAQFLGDVIVAWDARSDGTAEDDASPESEGLGSGSGVDQFLQVSLFIGREPDGGCFPSHKRRSLSRTGRPQR